MLKTYWTPKQMAAALESESRTLSTARYAQMSPEKRAQLDARAASVYAQYQAMHDFAYNSPWSHRDHGNSGSQPLTIESLYKLVNPQPIPETNAEARQLDAELAETHPHLCVCETCIAIAAEVEHIAFEQGEADDLAAETSTSAPILVDTPAGAQYALPGLTPPAAQLRFC
jgi:hypothetical protein